MAGIPIAREMDAKDLPPSLVTKVKKIIKDTNSSALPLKAIPQGAADHFTYKISVHEGENEMMMECNQYNLDDDLKSLIKYLEAHSKKRHGSN